MEFGDQNFAIALFEDIPIRRIWHEGRWFFSIVDIIAAIVQSAQPTRYWADVKVKIATEGGAELFGTIEKLPMPIANGKRYKTECADTETLLRIIQSVPSPRMEPIKRWLATVGTEALRAESEEEQTRRVAYRKMLYRVRSGLHADVRQRGINTPRDEQAFDDSGYQGLYEDLTEDDLRERFGLLPNDEPEDFMSAEEMGDNIFKDVQTRALISRRNIEGARNLNEAHYDVGVETRLTIERLGGTMPEDLPKERRIPQGAYLPEEKSTPDTPEISDDEE